ncbi:MAG TPA: NADH-quinone oxidoreductase subunit NuoF [bacterium]|nr:NADH-quinone oxidoreductase subunit NuoF [bacterium]
MGDLILTKHLGPDRASIDAYLATGGYRAAAHALRELTPDRVVEMVEQGGLRGRGGAGFPTGRKWKLTPKREGETRYLVVNADEAEPGTFKDRTLIEGDPHAILEGSFITAYANGVHHAYIYLRGEFFLGYERLSRALGEAYARGYFGRNILGTGFDLELTIHRGAGAYICGEETALLESLEGKRAFPRQKPPYYPAVRGLYDRPTVLNNAETMAHIPHIIAMGPEAYKAAGPPILYSVSGHVVRPGVKELPIGTPLRAIVFEHAGGLRPGRTLKAVYPGGSSSAILLPEHIDTPADFDSLQKIGTMLGSSAIIVMDDTTCVPALVARAVEFYRDESCGKCTPCREGTVWLSQIFERILAGRGRMEDLDLLDDVARNMTGTCFCLLGESVPPTLRASLKYFRDEYVHHIKSGACDLAPAATPAGAAGGGRA